MKIDSRSKAVTGNNTLSLLQVKVVFSDLFAPDHDPTGLDIDSDTFVAQMQTISYYAGEFPRKGL
ncbi:MAG: hypothetical protein LBR26_04435 [Prevotella sp.]|jgi:hypothetical protein|nr:hypothetical protein [Prevotella sp.]